MKLYNFSDESIKLAECAYALGYDTIGRESIPLNKNHSVQRVYMRNVRSDATLDNKFFPEIGVDEEVAVTYIMHCKEINEKYKAGGILHHDGICYQESREDQRAG